MQPGVTYQEIAWGLGYNAARDGKTEADCPYPECSKLRSSWLVGFECYPATRPIEEYCDRAIMVARDTPNPAHPGTIHGHAKETQATQAVEDSYDQAADTRKRGPEEDYRKPGADGQSLSYCSIHSEVGPCLCHLVLTDTEMEDFMESLPSVEVE